MLWETENLDYFLVKLKHPIVQVVSSKTVVLYYIMGRT